MAESATRSITVASGDVSTLLLEVAGARSTEQQFMLLLSESFGEGHCPWVLIACRLCGQQSCSVP
jgi:hypothetical protein